jgi:16S rRNA (adenine1518-N6/adenine1519-N6)-dimethyltransferase
MFIKKSLGQHFLRCRWVISALIETAGLTPEDIVLEIGPGTGTLTRALARRAKLVIAVEKDEQLADVLKNEFSKEKIDNVEIIPGDILKIFPQAINSHKLQDADYKLISNIPYYLTSRLLRVISEEEPRPKTIVLTIQKEVAERIVAKPPHMNLLALSVQAYGKPEIIKEVPASCFWPKPGVDSAIIKISDISDKFFQRNKIEPAVFYEILRMAFSKRRKMLVNSLGKAFGKEAIKKALKSAKMAETSRPEELYLKHWIKLILKLV